MDAGPDAARTALAGKDGFPPDTFLADVAREMHLSETAFVKMRPPPRQKKQPSAEGEADVDARKAKSRVSFPFDDAGSDENDASRDEGVDGASTNPPSPALSVASRSSAGESTKKVDRDAVAYVEYDLRWFTRSGFEVDLCGHATLAAAHALYELGPGAVPDGAVVRFHTRGGLIPVARVEDKKKPSREAADAPTEENGADDRNARKANAGGPLLELVLPCACRRAWRRSGGGTSRPPPTIRTTTTLRTTLRVVVRTERLRERRREERRGGGRRRRERRRGWRRREAAVGASRRDASRRSRRFFQPRRRRGGARRARARRGGHRRAKRRGGCLRVPDGPRGFAAVRAGRAAGAFPHEGRPGAGGVRGGRRRLRRRRAGPRGSPAASSGPTSASTRTP